MEIWKKWNPISNLKGKYYIDSLQDNEDSGLLMELSSEEDNKKLILNWDGIIISYLSSDETARSILYDNHIRTEWTFFQIEKSNYINWINEQSLGIYSLEKLQHFCIIGVNLVVDVVATYAPSVEEI